MPDPGQPSRAALPICPDVCVATLPAPAQGLGGCAAGPQDCSEKEEEKEVGGAEREASFQLRIQKGHALSENIKGEFRPVKWYPCGLKDLVTDETTLTQKAPIFP